MVPLSKSGVRKHRGFESRPLRHNRPPRGRPCVRWRLRSSLTHLGCARSGPRTPPSPGRPRDGRRFWYRLDAGAGGAASRYPASSGRGRLVDYGAALEMRFGATHRGFESRPLRHSPRHGWIGPCVRWRLRSSLTYLRVRSLRSSDAAFAWTAQPRRCGPAPKPFRSAPSASPSPRPPSRRADVLGTQPRSDP